MTSDVQPSPLLSVKQAIPPQRAGPFRVPGLELGWTAPTRSWRWWWRRAGWGKTSLLSRWASDAAPRRAGRLGVAG